MKDIQKFIKIMVDLTNFSKYGACFDPEMRKNLIPFDNFKQ